MIKPSFCVCGWVKGGIWRRCRGSPKSCAKGKIWVNEEKWHYEARLGHDKGTVQETTGWDRILRSCGFVHKPLLTLTSHRVCNFGGHLPSSRLGSWWNTSKVRRSWRSNNRVSKSRNFSRMRKKCLNTNQKVPRRKTFKRNRKTFKRKRKTFKRNDVHV